MTATSALSILGADDTLRERLMDKMKAAFIDAIPAAKMDAIMESAFDEFLNGPWIYRFKKMEKTIYSYDEGYDKTPGAENVRRWNEPINPPTIPDSYGRPATAYVVTQDKNTLPGMIYAMILEYATEFAKKTFSGPEYQGNVDWNTNNVTFIEGVVLKYLQENTANFVQMMFANVMQGAMSMTLSNLRNNNGGYR